MRSTPGASEPSLHIFASGIDDSRTIPFGTMCKERAAAQTAPETLLDRRRPDVGHVESEGWKAQKSTGQGTSGSTIGCAGVGLTELKGPFSLALTSLVASLFLVGMGFEQARAGGLSPIPGTPFFSSHTERKAKN